MEIRFIYMFLSIAGIVAVLFGLGALLGFIKHLNRPYKDENLLHSNCEDDNNFKGFKL